MLFYNCRLCDFQLAIDQHLINNTVDKESKVSRIMKAKFKTSCVECGDQISPGKEIAKNGSGTWVHKHCAPEALEFA